ncbi:MAG TPA: hypothetical protein PLB66_04970 [Bacteroidales bacterium]|nr:hypothetical protein [Bacteroidales bacterium]
MKRKIEKQNRCLYKLPPIIKTDRNSEGEDFFPYLKFDFMKRLLFFKRKLIDFYLLKKKRRENKKRRKKFNQVKVAILVELNLN